MNTDNSIRINRALVAVDTYDNPTLAEAVIDLLSDLMHLCAARVLDFDQLISTADDHYSEERNDE